MAVTEDQRVHVGLANVCLARGLLASMLSVLEPDDVALADVTDMWKAFDGIERLSANAKTLLAARVEESGSWKRAGARSAAEHLAMLGGTATSVTRRSLEHSKELPALAEVANAVRNGSLSSAQADAIVPAAAANPLAQDRLIAFAGSTNLTELRGECLRTRGAADPDPDTTHRRIRKGRCARTFADAEGAWNLVARGTADAGAGFESALEPIIDELFTRARAAGEREPRAAYAFDALIVLARRAEPEADSASEPTTEAETTTLPGAPDPAPPNASGRRRPRPKVRYLALLHLTFEAMTRGAIDPLCPHDHKLKTNQGWALVAGTGRRAFVSPADRRHPRHAGAP